MPPAPGHSLVGRTRYRCRVLAPLHARSPRSGGIALGVSLALALPVGSTSAPAWATTGRAAPAKRASAPDADETPATAAETEDPAMAESRRLYERGKARFDTFDYAGAVDLWTQAYAKLPADEASVRNSMVYNIATAQEKAFEIDENVGHLRQAVKLLETYIANYKALYPANEETRAEVEKAENRIATLEERIEQAERGKVRPPPPVEGEASGTVIGWNATPAPEPDPELLARNQQLAREERKTDRMLIASYVTLSLGGLFTLAGVATVVGTQAGDDSETGADDAARRNDAALGGGYGILVLGLAGVVAGFTLLGVGLDRRKKARNGVLVGATPTFGRGFAGASVRVRF